ncbi:MAG: hypothetical protein ABTQ34_05460 [Bdellovibrionales bacterium]
MTLGILCGLESEAKIARRVHKALVACAGARPALARQLAAQMIRDGATRMVSFGIAGGLAPHMGIASIAVGHFICSEKGSFEGDSEWADAIASRLGNQARRCRVWGSETLVATTKEKRMLHQTMACDIVDMESQCMAEVASEAKIPFAVLRAICDASDHEVPTVVMASIADDGSVNILAALRNLALNPAQIPYLLQVSRGVKKALIALDGTRSALAA